MSTTQNTGTPEAEISGLAKEAIQNRAKNGGKLVLADDIDPVKAVAVKAQVALLDTKSALTKAQQERTSLEAQNDVLLQQATTTLDLPPAEVERLEALSVSDPNAWRKEMNDLDKQAKEKLLENVTSLSAEGVKAKELKRRTELLTKAQILHPDLDLSEANISRNVPPRILQAMGSGELEFEDGMKTITQYLKAGVGVADPEPVLDQPNLTKAGGGAEPGGDKAKGSSQEWDDVY